MNNFFCNIPIYIINLEDSFDRKKHILNEFKNYDANIEFISAIDGRKSENFYYNYKVNYNSEFNFSTSLIAVICSHIKAIYKAYNSNLEKVCILEDDVHLDLLSNVNFNLNEICNINNDWEAIQIFYVKSMDYETDIKNNYNDYINNGLRLTKRDCNYSGTSYIINRTGMEKILNSIVITNGENIFNFIPNIIDPEDLILNYINSYIINRQLVFYYFNTMTFTNYDKNNIDDKKNCQEIHLKVKNLLLELYIKN